MSSFPVAFVRVGMMEIERERKSLWPISDRVRTHTHVTEFFLSYIVHRRLAVDIVLKCLYMA